jgi:hypothetical protein
MQLFFEVKPYKLQALQVVGIYYVLYSPSWAMISFSHMYYIKEAKLQLG